jgi:predicted RNase H-related nuclease YkuK (DUF458 family)
MENINLIKEKKKMFTYCNISCMIGSAAVHYRDVTAAITIVSPLHEFFLKYTVLKNASAY